MSFNKYLKIFIVSLFVILVALQAGKSFVLDEIDFPIVSQATSQSLKPIYYRGEVLPGKVDKHKPVYYLNSLPAHVGTYHPTLYINALATFMRVFGYSEVSVRLFGLICTLISAYLLVLILRQLTRKNEKAEILLLGLYLLNPYTIANTTLPDIDSTILPVLLLLLIHMGLKYLLEKRDMSNKAILILGSLFALTLWSKLTTPMVIPIFLVCVALITTREYKRSLFFVIKLTLLGMVLFATTYFIYCKLLGLSTTYTYTFLIESFTKGTSTDGPLVGALKNLANVNLFIYWPTIPVVGIFGLSVIGVLFNKDSGEKSQIKKLLILTGLLITVFYIALIPPFGGFFKYPFPVFGLLLLSVIFFYDQYLRQVKIKPWYLAGSFVGAFILERLVWSDTMFMNSKPYHYLWLLVVIVLFCALLLKFLRHNFVPQVLVLLIIAAVGFQFSISRVQAMSSYSTKYLYGQEGLDQTTAYLRSNTKSDEIIWSMKDVGYYVNNRYYESYQYYFDKSLQADLINMLREKKVKYYVTTTGIGQDNIDYYTDVKHILDDNAVVDRQFGNFIVYKVRD